MAEEPIDWEQRDKEWSKLRTVGGGVDWKKAAMVAGALIAPQEMEVIAGMQESASRGKYRQKMLEEQVRMRKMLETEQLRIRTVAEGTAKQAQIIGQIEKTTKFIEQSGGATFESKDEMKAFSDKYKIPEELFGQVMKEGKATGKWQLHDPDTQDNYIKMQRLMLQQSRDYMQQIGSIMAAFKTVIDIQTPKSTFTSEEGIMAIMPGGGVKKIGERPPAAVSAGERKSIAELEAGLENLDNLKSLFDEAYVGPLKGRVGAVKDMFGGNPQKQSEFYAAEAALKNEIIKLITGAQMGEREADRIVKQIPLRTDPPKVWQAKWEQTRRNRATLLKAIERGLKKGGKRSRTPSAAKTIATMTDEELEAIVRGGK